MRELIGAITQQNINGSVMQQCLKANISAIKTRPTAEYYKGDYEVTPLITAQVLPTNDKLMMDDLTIRKIPLYEVSNNVGGTTVTIGKEV